MTWGPTGYLVLHVSSEIGKNAAMFISKEIVQHNMDQLKDLFPVLVEYALKMFRIEQLTLILKELLDEEISIRDLRSILEGLLSVNGTTDVVFNKYIVFAPNTGILCPVTDERTLNTLSSSDYANCIRMSLRDYISHKYTRRLSALVVYLISPEIEERLLDVDVKPLLDEEYRRLITAIKKEAGHLLPGSNETVILTIFAIRKKLKDLIKKDFPDLPVLCYQELAPEINIQPVAKITWPKDDELS